MTWRVSYLAGFRRSRHCLGCAAWLRQWFTISVIFITAARWITYALYVATFQPLLRQRIRHITLPQSYSANKLRANLLSLLSLTIYYAALLHDMMAARHEKMPRKYGHLPNFTLRHKHAEYIDDLILLARDYIWYIYIIYFTKVFMRYILDSDDDMPSLAFYYLCLRRYSYTPQIVSASHAIIDIRLATARWRRSMRRIDEMLWCDYDFAILSFSCLIPGVVLTA